MRNIIDFTYDVSNKEAFRQVAKYSFVILRNTWRSIDAMAHKYPWVLVGVTIAVSLLICTAIVGNERAERNGLDHEIVELKMKGE